MTIEELRLEYRDQLIGPMWLALVREVCRQITLSYSARVYAGTESWRDGLDDLVQDVVTNAFLRDHQLEYLMDEARTMKDVRRLLGRQVRHVLARGRTRTVVDQLLDRSRRILSNEPFVTIELGHETRWALEGRSPLDRAPTATELRQAETIARGYPIVPYAGSERAPIIYREESLKHLLEGIAERMLCSFGMRDLDLVFRKVLTGFLPSVLNRVERPQGRSTEPEDANEMRQAAAQVCTRLDSTQRQLLGAKLIGVSDADVGKRLQLSRPTVAKRKEEVFQIVRESSNDLNEASRETLIDELSILLVREWTPSVGGESEPS